MNGMLFVFLGVSCSDTTFLTRHQVSFDVEVVPSLRDGTSFNKANSQAINGLTEKYWTWRVYCGTCG